MDIAEDEKLQDLFMNRNLKPATRTSYTKVMKDYCKFIGLTPTELINEADYEEINGIRKMDRRIRRYLINYQNYLLNKDASPKSIKQRVSIVRSFYNEYELELPKYSLNLPKDDDYLTNEDIITLEHVEIALKHANNKYRAIILLMMSSGMGSNEVRHLKVSDFLKSIKKPVNKDFDVYELSDNHNEGDVGFWSIKRIKTGMPYFTFSSPESLEAIITYLKERQAKQGHIDVDSFLFDVNGEQTAAKSIYEYFRKLNYTCNFGFQGRQVFFRSHGLRKFFASKLHERGMQQLNTDWLLGHRVKSQTDSYFKRNIEALKNEYLQLLPFLSLSRVETVTIESDEVKSIRKELEDMKQVMKRFMELEKKME